MFMFVSLAPLEYHPMLTNKTEHIQHSKCDISYVPHRQCKDINPTEEHFIEDLLKAIKKINPILNQTLSR